MESHLIKTSLCPGYY